MNEEDHICFCGPCSKRVRELEARLSATQEVRNAYARRVSSARSIFMTLRRYRAVQGNLCESANELVGLAYDGSIWGPTANPKYEMFELAEAFEKWLKDKCDEAMLELDATIGESNG